jgi:GNAT superfamily N-acetyltransferase
MKERLGTVLLRNRASGKDEPADLFQELDDKNIEDFERLWRPMLRSKRTGDSHWKWAEKARAATRLTQYETFAVECGGRTQGLMFVNLMKYARIPEQQGRELVYVELIATAPWNRPRLVASPEYKGVGRVLIATAISLSADLGFNGRIGLHSLEDSESWYRDVAGFTDLGFEEAKKMQYFEMTEAQVAAFLDDRQGEGP